MPPPGLNGPNTGRGLYCNPLEPSYEERISNRKHSLFYAKSRQMKQFTLHIETPENRSVVVDGETSIGRTPLAKIVIADNSLSRVHATFAVEGDELWLYDENSTNGSFVNGKRVTESEIKDGDEIRLGIDTHCYAEIRERPADAAGQNSPAAGDSFSATRSSFSTTQSADTPVSAPQIAGVTKQYSAGGEKFPTILIVAAASTVAIIIFAGIGLLIARSYGAGNGDGKGNTPAPPVARAGTIIPVKVIDPLGGQDPDDIDDLMASWEVEEKPLDAADVDEIKTTASNGTSDLKVSVEYWQKQRDKALNHGSQGVNDPVGLAPLPVELIGGGVPKQKAKLAEMIAAGIYKQPMDFADLAEKRLSGQLIELPMATESWVLDVGGSASEDEFKSFEFETGPQPIPQGSPKYKILQQLADNFDGQKYDLNNGRDRKQMRIRLLRMYNPKSRKVLEEICGAYAEKFHVPLRITSLTRSMDYQIGLNKTNANSFKVSGKGSLPPHTSGCAFDMSRKNLPAAEQNFMMALLSGMERNHRIDSLREGSDNACFHTFIYPDGIEPKG
jgi:FHA domain/Family of unknown function (DUF5715)